MSGPVTARREAIAHLCAHVLERAAHVHVAVQRKALVLGQLRAASERGVWAQKQADASACVASPVAQQPLPRTEAADAASLDAATAAWGATALRAPARELREARSEGAGPFAAGACGS